MLFSQIFSEKEPLLHQITIPHTFTFLQPTHSLINLTKQSKQLNEPSILPHNASRIDLIGSTKQSKPFPEPKSRRLQSLHYPVLLLCTGYASDESVVQKFVQRAPTKSFLRFSLFYSPTKSLALGLWLCGAKLKILL